MCVLESPKIQGNYNSCILKFQFYMLLSLEFCPLNQFGIDVDE